MRYFAENMIIWFFKFVLWFRYRVTIKGLENLNSKSLPKPGGVIFLPNHPAVFVDPILVSISIWKKYPIRPIIVEYMYYAPVINNLMRFLDALPIPNHEVSSNSIKRKRSEKALEAVVEGIKQGQNFLIYPAGRLKNTSQEVIGGASGVHQILQGLPETNVVLVRTTGLWGSGFSKAFTGKTPEMFSVVSRGILNAFKNLLFFMPRRKVTIEFVPAPANFPYHASRMELNKYLENWYNHAEGPSGPVGEPLNLVSYSFWRQEVPVIKPKTSELSESEKIDLERIPEAIQHKVIIKLSELAEMPEESIKPELSISNDIGLDSLDTAELVVFLEDEFDIKAVPVKELTTVGKLMAIASRQIVCAEEEETAKNLADWKKKLPHKRVYLAPGKTIPEVFFNNCDRMGNALACADLRVGTMTYPTLKLRALLLAEYVRKLPGDHIGIILPSSVIASVLILACQIAGKVPVIINWTAGSRHLESVIKLSGIKVILTSWAFVDRLTNVDLVQVDEMLVMLEDVRRELTWSDQLKAYWRSKKSTRSLLKLFHLEKIQENSRAVLIFTSGTESLPKGVPLTHRNILSNQQADCEVVDIYQDDVLLAILPPFHAFGLTICSLLGLLSGFRVAYYPDPTDGPGIAKEVENWSATIVCGAPTFLKKMLKAGSYEQLKTLRYVVTGAEKAPADLFQQMDQLGLRNKLYEGYGITECSPVLTWNRPGTPPKGVGHPVPNVELCIVNPDTLEVLGQGQQGLILARGPNVFSGYLNPGIASPFVSVKGKEWYQTGDLGYLDETGRLTISGRLKRFIKLGAEMISLTSIEEALLQAASQKGWSSVDEGPSVAVCAKEIPGDKPRIFVFTKFATNLDEVNQSLRDAGFSNLVKVSTVQHLDEIPIMGTGKVHYRELEAKYIAAKS